MCYIVYGYWIPFCFCSKGSLPPFGKDTACKIEKIRENKNVLHAAI